MSDRRGVANASAMTNPRSAFPAHARGVEGSCCPRVRWRAAVGGGARDVSVDPAPGRRCVPRRRRRVSFIEKSKQRLAVVQKYKLLRARARGQVVRIAAWMLVDLCWCQEQQEGLFAAAALRLGFLQVSHRSRTDGARTRCTSTAWRSSSGLPGNVLPWRSTGPGEVGTVERTTEAPAPRRRTGEVQARVHRLLLRARRRGDVLRPPQTHPVVRGTGHPTRSPRTSSPNTNSDSAFVGIVARERSRQPPARAGRHVRHRVDGERGSRMSAGAASFASPPTVAGGAALTYGSVESAVAAATTTTTR